MPIQNSKLPHRTFSEGWAKDERRKVGELAQPSMWSPCGSHRDGTAEYV